MNRSVKALEHNAETHVNQLFPYFVMGEEFIRKGAFIGG